MADYTPDAVFRIVGPGAPAELPLRNAAAELRHGIERLRYLIESGQLELPNAHTLTAPASDWWAWMAEHKTALLAGAGALLLFWLLRRTR